MNTKLAIILGSLSLLLIGCKDSQKTDKHTTHKVDTADAIVTEKKSIHIGYNVHTTNPQTAEKIKNFLRKKLAKELEFIDSQSRVFSFYEVDLNDDRKNEYFISMEGLYFCGSGGGSFYLLNHDFTVNSYFTVTRPPIFVSSKKTGGWHDLILWGDADAQGGIKNYIHLKFNKTTGRYPGNPSLIGKTELAPSGHDFVMWDDTFSPAKPFSF